MIKIRWAAAAVMVAGLLTSFGMPSDGATADESFLATLEKVDAAVTPVDSERPRA